MSEGISENILEGMFVKISEGFLKKILKEFPETFTNGNLGKISGAISEKKSLENFLENSLGGVPGKYFGRIFKKKVTVESRKKNFLKRGILKEFLWKFLENNQRKFLEEFLGKFPR